MMIMLLGLAMSAFVLVAMFSGFLIYAFVCLVFSMAALLGIITWLGLCQLSAVLFPEAVSTTGLMFVAHSLFAVVSIFISAAVGLAAIKMTYEKLIQSNS